MTAGDQLEILARLGRIEDIVDDVHKSITGDPSLGHKGIAERLEKAETLQAQEANDRREGLKRVHARVDKLERNWAAVMGAVLGSGLAGGGVAAAIVKFWN